MMDDANTASPGVRIGFPSLSFRAEIFVAHRTVAMLMKSELFAINRPTQILLGLQNWVLVHIRDGVRFSNGEEYTWRHCPWRETCPIDETGDEHPPSVFPSVESSV